LFLKRIKPHSNGSRWVFLYNKFNILKLKSQPKMLLNKNRSGRNISGQIVTRHRKSIKTYIIKYTDCNYFSTLLLVSSFFCLKRKFYSVMELLDHYGNYFYSRKISGLFYGDIIRSFPLSINSDDDFTGSRIQLSKIFLGQVLCNLLLINSSRKISISSGTYCTVLSINYELNLCTVLLPSGKNKIVSTYSRATLGRISNERNNSLV
jgi:ribosomal protein L2